MQDQEKQATEGPARVGVDIGGTFLKGGCVRGGRLVRRGETPTPTDYEALVEAIAALAREVACGPLASVGVGLPGVVDPATGTVRNAPNLPFVDGRPIVADLEARTGVPVAVENDANVAALGEARHGAGRQHRDFLLATLGTGIGGGLVLDGRLFRGPGGMAGEFGHLNVDSGRLCGCGARGCLEAAVSARNLALWARDEGLPVADLKELAALARRGDAKARSLFQRAGAFLGEGLAQVALLLDLRVFLIGGGGAPVLDLLKPSALPVLATRAFGREARDFAILQAELGNDAGILGAAELPDHP